ncbi:helix-turn-helix domain-containing protein [Actinocorallia longicatena]|uniref:HTH tetR-type domain-containing protein n=1 Tax=Actinocorallia longicatena TaxID=111803 RepID=A0ABP6Q3P0_9ACTN
MEGLREGDPEVAARRRMTPAQRRADLTGTALEVFAEKGYRATAMADIAEASGVNRSILYDRFPSKRALYLTVLQEQHVAVLAALGVGLAGHTGTRGRIAAVVEGYLRYARACRSGRRLLFDVAPEDDPEIRIVRHGIAESRTRTLALLLGPDLLRIGIEPGSDAAGLRAEVFLSGLDGLARWWEEHDGLSHEEITAIAMRMLWTGLEV